MNSWGREEGKLKCSFEILAFSSFQARVSTSGFMHRTGHSGASQEFVSFELGRFNFSDTCLLLSKCWRNSHLRVVRHWHYNCSHSLNVFVVFLTLELMLCKAQLSLAAIWRHSFKPLRILGLKIGFSSGVLEESDLGEEQRLRVTQPGDWGSSNCSMFYLEKWCLFSSWNSSGIVRRWHPVSEYWILQVTKPQHRGRGFIFHAVIYIHNVNVILLQVEPWELLRLSQNLTKWGLCVAQLFPLCRTSYLYQRSALRIN